MYDAFIVTKPLQYINVLNINCKNERILLLVDAFIDAKALFININRTSSFWSQTLFFYKLSDAFEWLIINRLNIETLYIDSDINNRRIFRKLSKLNLSVYEEGIGTYNQVVYKPRRKIIGSIYLYILRIWGYQNRRGGNKYTKNIIVYFPEFYIIHQKEFKRKVLSFNKTFIELLKDNRELEIFGENYDFSDLKNKNVLLYLPDWEIDHEEMEQIIKNNTYEFTIIKPHPHLMDCPSYRIFNLQIQGSIPAELIIMSLIKYVKKLSIVSKYSTSGIYFIDNPKVELINIIPKPSDYTDLDSYLKTYNALVDHIRKRIS